MRPLLLYIKLSFFYLIVLSPLFLNSCQPDEVCRLNIDVFLGVGVSYITQTDADGTQKNVEVDTWDSVTVWGVGNDSILYDNDKNATTLRLYLRSDTTQTKYVILWHDKTDTLTITHSNKFEFISMACGCIVDYTLQSVTHSNNFIDTVVIQNPEINLMENQHIKLYLQTNAR